MRQAGQWEKGEITEITGGEGWKGLGMLLECQLPSIFQKLKKKPITHKPILFLENYFNKMILILFLILLLF